MAALSSPNNNSCWALARNSNASSQSETVSTVMSIADALLTSSNVCPLKSANVLVAPGNAIISTRFLVNKKKPDPLAHSVTAIDNWWKAAFQPREIHAIPTLRYRKHIKLRATIILGVLERKTVYKFRWLRPRGEAIRPLRGTLNQSLAVGFWSISFRLSSIRQDELFL
mmetsp:Transcript_28835/g.78122  ORF Transcript_28835/g.78122 Transcript_28835/m.78122 type:complete len:169 (-) Transcript_28835:301-807(-)